MLFLGLSSRSYPMLNSVEILVHKDHEVGHEIQRD